MKIKTYKLPVNLTFPTMHDRHGEPTFFIPKIELALGLVNRNCEDCNRSFISQDLCKECFIFNDQAYPKLHVIRTDYTLWSKCIKEVQAGRAIIELYYWRDKPFKSEQVVFATLDKNSGCGVQQIILPNILNISRDNLLFKFPELPATIIDRKRFFTKNRHKDIDLEILAEHEGLSLNDFKNWFQYHYLREPMAIIHFTNFRY